MCRGENVIFKFELILRKFNLHLQYYKNDLSFSIKLQEINFNVCEECKTEPEARTENTVLLDDPKLCCRNKIIFLLFMQQNCFDEPEKIFCWSLC